MVRSTPVRVRHLFTVDRADTVVRLSLSRGPWCAQSACDLGTYGDEAMPRSQGRNLGGRARAAEMVAWHAEKAGRHEDRRRFPTDIARDR